MKQDRSPIKQRTQNFLDSAFEYHSGRRANTLLSNFCTTPNYSDLSYDKTLSHYLDEETVTLNDFFPKNTGEHTALTKRLSAKCVRLQTMHRRENEMLPITNPFSAVYQNSIVQPR